MCDKDDRKNEFELPSQSYHRILKQYDDWLVSHGYVRTVEQGDVELSFRLKSKRLLYLMMFISDIYGSGNEK